MFRGTVAAALPIIGTVTAIGVGLLSGPALAQAGSQPPTGTQTPAATQAPAGSQASATTQAPAITRASGAAVGFTQTVYRGADHGAGCASAHNFAEALQGDRVTYCFTVTNTGQTYLSAIVVVDPLVAGTPALISADASPLGPGQSARYYVEAVPPPDAADGTVDDTYLNSASVSAVAVDAAGKPRPNTAKLAATATSIVYPPEVVPVPALSLATSIYAGHDHGQGCPAAIVATANQGDPVTYCLTVTNTGNTNLSTIAFSDLGVTGTPLALGDDPMPLAPGVSARYFLEASAPAVPAQGFAAKALATANAVDASGADLTGIDKTSATGAVTIKPATVGPEGATRPKAGADQSKPAAVAKPAKAKSASAAAHAAGAKAAPQAASKVAAAPKQLAFTGWETWLMFTAGIALAAAGWLLFTSSPRAPALVVNRRRRSEYHPEES